MHSYATDSSERKSIPFFLAALGILAAWILGWIVQKTQISIPWWVDAPAVVGFYGLFYKIFDTWIWRFEFLRKIGVIKLPDLNGVWQGNVSSSYDNYSKEHEAKLKIHQTWTQISIYFESEKSESYSLSGMITAENPVAKALSYEFRNEPKVQAIETMHSHRGMARLTLSLKDKNEFLDGEYFTGRDRQTYGRMHFEKIKQ